MRKPMSAMLALISLDFSMASISDAIFIHGLATTHRTLRWLLVQRYHLHAQINSPTQRNQKKGEFAGVCAIDSGVQISPGLLFLSFSCVYSDLIIVFKHAARAKPFYIRVVFSVVVTLIHAENLRSF
jgi:hypothetical protein